MIARGIITYERLSRLLFSDLSSLTSNTETHIGDTHQLLSRIELVQYQFLVPVRPCV